MEKTKHQKRGFDLPCPMQIIKFAVIGDRGINKVVPSDFWEQQQGLQ